MENGQKSETILTIVASDGDLSRQQVCAVVVRSGLECTPQCQVNLEIAADRAIRLGAQLIVLVLPPDAERGLDVLREVTRLVQAPVLVVGPAGDAKFILRTLHLGADEYLDENRAQDELSEAIVRLKARLQAPTIHHNPGRVIAVLGPSGGCGSSTVAVNIATSLAKKHGKAALLDLRLTAGDLPALLDVRPPHTLADLCDNVARIDRTMFEQMLARHASGVHVLAAPRNFAELHRITTKGVRQAVSLARSEFPYAVLDVDNTFDEEQVEALWQADVIVLVLRLDFTSVRNVRRTLDRLKETGVGLDRVKLVVNRYGEAKQLRVAQAEEALGMKISHFIPNDPASVNRSVNAGVPVVVQRASAKVSRSLGELAHSVNGRVS